MFYLKKQTDERQCARGDRVMVLADFVSVPAGTKGTIVEVYNGGVMVQWEDLRPTGMPMLRDGFSRDELKYLAFETEKHPKNV
ncbi:MAG: hypothetical protein PHI63_06850 [Patescibacteria group bacterium]|nr:hypothetical protein [Patescibacteria group bacterium]